MQEEESGSSKRQSARIRFIEQFLKQGQQNRLAGLLLGQLDAFNRIATTFGHEQCETVLRRLLRALARPAAAAHADHPSLGAPLCRAGRLRLDVEGHGCRRRSDGRQPSTARSRRRSFPRRRHARHRGLSLACRRRGHAVPPGRARAEGSARERAGLRHLSSGRDAAASGALEVRVGAAKCRSARPARGVLPTEGRACRATSVRCRGAGPLAHAVRQFRPGQRFHPVSGEQRRHRAADLARLRSDHRATSSTGMRSPPRSRWPSTSRHSSSRKPSS